MSVPDTILCRALIRAWGQGMGCSVGQNKAGGKETTLGPSIKEVAAIHFIVDACSGYGFAFPALKTNLKNSNRNS